MRIQRGFDRAVGERAQIAWHERAQIAWHDEHHSQIAIPVGIPAIAAIADGDVVETIAALGAYGGDAGMATVEGIAKTVVGLASRTADPIGVQKAAVVGGGTS